MLRTIDNILINQTFFIDPRILKCKIMKNLFPINLNQVNKNDLEFDLREFILGERVNRNTFHFISR